MSSMSRSSMRTLNQKDVPPTASISEDIKTPLLSSLLLGAGHNSTGRANSSKWVHLITVNALDSY